MGKNPSNITERELEKMNDDNPRQSTPDWLEDLWEQMDNQELE